MNTSKLAVCGYYAVLPLSLTLAFTACGGGSGGTSSTSTPAPPPPPSTASQWTWVAGSKTISKTDKPSGRAESVTWIDANGNLWLFGGSDEASSANVFNDLWEFSPTSKSWAQISGSTTSFGIGVYGTKGVAAAANVPGARYGSSGWIDSGGNLWLFGGYGIASSGSALQYLNDLWQFNPTTRQWAWISGSNTASSPGVYGTISVTSPTNVPGARYRFASWKDPSGNFWLFGGQGYYSAGSLGLLNDLWKFDSTSKQWIWMSGSSTGSSSSIYGTVGLASTSNVPGGREGPVSWTDSSGNLWLFGGLDGSVSAVSDGVLNDLWEFNPANGTWVWVSGSSVDNASGIYGALGTPSSTNTPGARFLPAAWIDKSGNLWLCGGTNNISAFNDLWRFSPTAKTWTWISGSNAANAVGNCGTQGTVSATNVPGARVGSAGWIDASGNLWLFGGAGLDSAAAVGPLSDLWSYQP
jgi:N-acetylneuraminic acid mutarotase